MYHQNVLHHWRAAVKEVCSITSLRQKRRSCSFASLRQRKRASLPWQRLLCGARGKRRNECRGGCRKELAHGITSSVPSHLFLFASWTHGQRKRRRMAPRPGLARCRCFQTCYCVFPCLSKRASPPGVLSLVCVWRWLNALRKLRVLRFFGRGSQGGPALRASMFILLT